MQNVDQALDEVSKLYQQVMKSPVPEVGPQTFVPIPAGLDPVAFAINEVAQLRTLLESGAGAVTAPGQAAWEPRSNIFTSDADIRFLVELPGLSREEVSVSVVAGELVIRGERQPPTAEGLRPFLVEQPWGAFERRFPIPPWSDSDEITATYAQGILEIQIPRTEGNAMKEVRVEIDANAKRSRVKEPK